jgi:hypothetical protein
MRRTAGPSVDETYELLSHRTGRLVLQYFDQHPNPVKLEEIAPKIAHWEARSGTAPTDEDVDAVRTALHGKYFPWLVNLGLATYDSDGQMVRYDAEEITTAIANVDAVLKFVWSLDGALDAEVTDPLPDDVGVHAASSEEDEE